MCKLHLARIAINQTADAVGEGSGFIQPPLQSGKNVLYGSSPAGGNGKQVDDQFVHEVVVEESPQQFQRFGIGNFNQIGKGIVFAVFLAQQVQNGVESLRHSVHANGQNLSCGSLPIASTRYRIPEGTRPMSSPLLPVSLPCRLSKKEAW